MKLVIVESPNKVRKIKDFLGSEYQVAASFGHVRDLPPTGGLSVEFVDGKIKPVCAKLGGWKAAGQAEALDARFERLRADCSVPSGGGPGD